MLGGPPQQETFDLKPDAPAPQEPVQANCHQCAGDSDCELLPDLARQADRFAIVRSVYHDANALFHGARASITASPAGRVFRARENPISIGATIRQSGP